MADQKHNDIEVLPQREAETNPAADAWHDLADSEDRADRTGTATPDRPESRGSGDRYWTRFLIIAAILGGLIVSLNLAFGGLSLKQDFAEIGYAVVLVLVVSWGLASGSTGRNLKYLSIWGGIFLVLMVGYAYRHDLSRVKDKVMAEFLPMQGYQQAPASMSFPVASDGHYYIRADVNDVPITFLADTGASHIVISPHDARKMGLDPGMLAFDRFYETANGTVRGSSIRLDTFTVGELRFNEIHASVNEADMQHSLLGMTFFKRLRGYEVRDEVLTLHW